MTGSGRKEAGRAAARLGSGVKYPSRGCGGETPASRSEQDDRTKAIAKAAAWLANTPESDRPAHLIPHLRKAYDLSVAQAIAAIRKANEIRRDAA